MSGNLKFSSQSLEEMILASCVLFPSFFIKIQSYLDTNEEKGKSYFNDEKFQEIFNLFSKFINKYGEPPSKKTFLAIVERVSQVKEYSEEVSFYLQKIAENMFSAKEEEYNLPYIEEQTQNFIKENRVYEAISKSPGFIEENNYSALVSTMEDAVRVNFDKDLGMSIKDYEDIMRKINEITDEKVIKTGYPKLDQYLDGGLRQKEIYVVSAIPGTGKTLLMGNIGMNAYLDGKNVAFYTFETSTERLFMRNFQSMILKSKKEILLDEKGTVDGIREATKDIIGDFIIKEYNSNEASSADMMAHLRDLKTYKNWEPDLVIVDYILIMRANDARMNPDNSYKYYKTVTEELRNIGKTFSVPILTATQINREGMSDRGGSKAILTAKDMSESRGIFDTADFFAPIVQTANDRTKNRFSIIGEKQRNGEVGWRIHFDIDYEHMLVKESSLA